MKAVSILFGVMIVSSCMIQVMIAEPGAGAGAGYGTGSVNASRAEVDGAGRWKMNW